MSTTADGDFPSWQPPELGLGKASIAAILLVGLIIAFCYWAAISMAPKPVPQAIQVTQATLTQLPKPTPPPPPKVIPPPEKAVVERPREQANPQKAAATPKPAKLPSPPAAVTTSITGPGPGSLASGNGGGGDCLGAGCGSGDGTGGDNDAYYGGIVKSQIEAAIRRDEKLRYATYTLRVSFRLDGSGHITHASIGAFSGDSDIRAEVSRVLDLVSTNDAPPADITAKTFTVSISEHLHG